MAKKSNRCYLYFSSWCGCHFRSVGSRRHFPRLYIFYRRWRHTIERKQHRSGNEVVMAKIYCHSLLSGSSWSSFEEDSPMDEAEGMCDYHARNLCSQIRWKAPEKLFFRGFTLFCFYPDSNGCGRKQWLGHSRGHAIAQRRYEVGWFNAVFTQIKVIISYNFLQKSFRPEQILL